MRDHRCKVLNLGLLEYMDAYRLQKQLTTLRRERKIGDVLLLLEHKPVITIGRKGRRENILAEEDFLREKGITIFSVERGGDVTLHCPGQIVGYPIIDLINYGKDIHKYLRDLEEVIIITLRVYGITGKRCIGLTGVWVGEEKIASIGVAIKDWVTFHGFSVNVNCDLSFFSLIRPCGLDGTKMTSLKKILGREVEMQDLAMTLGTSFGEVFCVEMEHANKEISLLAQQKVAS